MSLHHAFHKYNKNFYTLAGNSQAILKFIRNTSLITGADEEHILADYHRTGDLKLLGGLYQNYMPLVYGVCLKYLKDEEKSKDAVMQIFEQLIDKLRAHQVSNFKSWLYMLSRNFCLMELRASGRQQTIPLEENFMENDAFVHLDIDDTREQKLTVLEECLEKLPEGQKETVKLFYLEQKCYREVADETGFDMNKVKSYIQNGKRNLKICIEKNSGNA